jgi:hypothetical protein
MASDSWVVARLPLLRIGSEISQDRDISDGATTTKRAKVLEPIEIDSGDEH